MPTSVASITIEDFTGARKTAPMYFDDAASLADITGIIQGTATLLDDVIDGKIVGINVTLSLALPGGLKADAIEGNTVHEGALLSFAADDTARTFSVYIPSWENDGFSGDSVLTTGDYAALQNAYVNGIVSFTADPTDQYSNDLTAFSVGRRTFRK